MNVKLVYCEDSHTGVGAGGLSVIVDLDLDATVLFRLLRETVGKILTSRPRQFSEALPLKNN